MRLQLWDNDACKIADLPVTGPRTIDQMKFDIAGAYDFRDGDGYFALVDDDGTCIDKLFIPR